MEQIHAGVCGTHMNGLTLARKILRAGYFWMTMEHDCCKFDELNDADWIRKRIDQLTLINEKRMVAVCHGQMYQQRMIRAFHKKVKARIFEVGQLVLKRIFPHQDEYKGKFAPNWQGPYMVRKVLFGGALVLSEMDGTEWPKPINSDVVKRNYM
ncbi:hypothetical protein R3W88_027493 [Solanum pinnatisectum]|uniref:Uncharacterized protein n=1 Tax=Solanum pinnatisectum TaxID=50273 RepID=A0AAV9LJ06_9SOLN|nr:hypothetical protein R3W88_027493 [Solanum pinnatisectum]